MDLSERKQKILQVIIDEYIGTAEPVGSRAISKRDELGLSSATIRNEMADLEDMGYLVKPHTSAGRVPSDIGYRFYVNSLMQKYQLGMEAIEVLRSGLAERVNQLDTLIKKASMITSALTEYTTVVTAPMLSRSVIRKIDVIAMSSGTAMLIVVTKSGLVRNRMIAVDIYEKDATKISELLNRFFVGVITDCITEAEISELAIAATQAGLPTAAIKVVLSSVYEFITNIDEYDVYVNNARSILQYPEFADVDKAREMLDFLENRDNLIKIIDSGHNIDGVGIKIGTENNAKELENSSLVTVDYRLGSRTLGKIGVIGPKRMNYAKVIASLDLISDHIDKILEQLYSTEGEG
ncbi:MAG: heat-inducible transcriptional repressor HrcA [Clostridia bacterium]|nr:heat-inducible transcriptional repressor HrcA [Clostridia bacterium]